jgi:hypothetical protein
MQRRHFLLACTAAPLLAACGGGDDQTALDTYSQVNLVASQADAAELGPLLADTESDAEFLNAWGIAIRPAGAGGHFWVTAGGWSCQFLGDVSTSSDPSLHMLTQEALTLVRLPGAGAPADGGDVTDSTRGSKASPPASSSTARRSRRTGSS